MHEQLTHQEIHALDVVGLVVVAGEGPKHFPQFSIAAVADFEKIVFRKSAIQISINLQRWF